MNRAKEWALAIQEMEGYRPGTIAYRNLNPGNLKWSKFQAGQRNGFAFFNSYSDGLNALIFDISQKALGRTSLLKPTDTIYKFCQVYAPSSDGNYPLRYAEFIASKLNLSIYSTLNQIISEDAVQKILFVVSDFLPLREPQIRLAIQKVEDFFDALGIETAVEVIYDKFLPIQEVVIKAALGDTYELKDVTILDPKVVRDKVKINGQHIVLFCYRTEKPGNTGIEFNEAYKGAIWGQLPILDASDPDTIKLFMIHEILHGWYDRAIMNGLSVQDDVHKRDFSDIVKGLKPYVQTIFKPIPDKPYTAEITPLERLKKIIELLKILITQLLAGRRGE